jgi:hypothetical protein
MKDGRDSLYTMKDVSDSLYTMKDGRDSLYTMKDGRDSLRAMGGYAEIPCHEWHGMVAWWPRHYKL